jgi:hypothetical protein
MKKLLLESKLNEIENLIEHQRSVIIRANDMLELLKTEQKNLKDFDLNRYLSGNTLEMVNQINKFQLIDEIKFSIMVLDNYLKTNSFNLIAISNHSDINYGELNDYIRKIVTKYELS